MPMHRSLYPANWPEISRRVRRRAGWRCEWPGCTRKQGDTAQGKRGPYKIILTVAHLNHDPADCRPDNLAAWCQPHHLAYDATHHARNAAQTRRRRKLDAGQLEMFGEAING